MKLAQFFHLIKRGKNIEKAQDIVTEKELLLRGAETEEKGLKLQESNIERRKRIAAEKELLKPTETTSLKTSANDILDKFEQENPNSVPSKGKKKRRFQPKKSGNTKLYSSMGATGVLAAPFIKMGYDAYKEEYMGEGLEDDEATAKAILMSIADVTPYVSAIKMAFEPKTVAAAQLRPDELFRTKEDMGQAVMDVSKERTFRKDIAPQLKEEGEVGSKMMRKYKQESALSEMRKETQQKLDEELQKLNIRR